MEHPAFRSASPDLVLEGMELSPTKRSYRITVRSRAAKDVRGIEIYTRSGARPLSTMAKIGEDGSALLPAGRAIETSVFLSPAHRPDAIEITSVLWSDGTFSGAPRWAAEQVIVDRAAAIQTANAAKLLCASAQAAPTGADSPIALLRAKISELPETAADDLFSVVIARPLPAGLTVSDKDARSLAAIGLRSIKKQVADALNEFEVDRAGRSSHPAGVEAEWMNRQGARYEAYAERLRLSGR